MKRTALRLGLLSALLLATRGAVHAQKAASGTDLVSLMRDVCAYQVKVLQRRDSGLRYRMHRSDHKGDSTREVIESRDGVLSRVVQRDGQALSAEDNADQEKKLRLLADPAKLRDRDKDDQRGRSYGVELLQAMPTAMRFSLPAQQTPLPDVALKQIVVDFDPDPAFHPSGWAQQLLTSIAGRMWITQADHRLLRVEMHNTGDVNLAWGLLAKVYPGGSLLYEQRPFQDLYTYTRIVMHMKMRALMVKTQSMDVETTTSEFQRLPTPPSGEEAAHMLLAMPVTTR